MYVVCIRERYSFSLVCIYKKAIKYFEVKVDVQRGPLGFRDFFDNKCVSYI